MALKGPRETISTDITRTCSTAAVAGQILVHKTSGSGVALGDSRSVSEVSASSSGKVVTGVIMHKVVDIDETVRHRNYHNGEMLINEPCNQMTKGWLVTNILVGTPTVGAIAYLSSSGYLTPTVDANGGIVATPKVGRFDSIKDANGYCKVLVDVPIV